MDPDAYNGGVAVATMGTKLEFSEDGAAYTRVYGLASTPDLGGEPNTIDSTVLDNTEYETAVMGLQPAIQLSYEFNVMNLKDPNVEANLRQLYKYVDPDDKDNYRKVLYWRLTKASGITIEYTAVPRISYSGDEQGNVERFSMYHELKSAAKVSLPTAATNE